MIEKIDGCKNNPENSSTVKVSEHITSAFSMSTISSFRSIENKHDLYRGKDCIERFCEFVSENAMKIIGFKKIKLEIVPKDWQKSYGNAKICHISKENLKINV